MSERDRRLELIDHLLVDADPVRVEGLRAQCLRQLRQRRRQRLLRPLAIAAVLVLGLGVSWHWSGGATSGSNPTPPDAPAPPRADPAYLARTAPVPTSAIVRTSPRAESVQVTQPTSAYVVHTTTTPETLDDDELLACFPDQPVALFTGNAGHKELRFLGP